MGASGGQSSLEGVVAIDGKTLCGSRDTPSGKGAIQMVSAWARTNSMVLGQVKVDDKSNEITAIPVLLKLFDLTGCIVTIDAIGLWAVRVKLPAASMRQGPKAGAEGRGRLRAFTQS